MPDSKEPAQRPAEVNALTFDEEYPFATSPFDEERRPPEVPRDKVVLHTTIGGKGVVGRLGKP